MKKLFKITLGIFFSLLLITIGVLFVGRMSENDQNIFGYRSFIILSDSMKPTFQAGDLIFVKSVDIDTLRVGDIISYKSRNPVSFGDIITHQIIEIKPDGKQFITQGINAESSDEYVVYEDLILGKYQAKVPKLGYVIQFMQSNTGFVLMFIVPLSLMIVTEFFHFIRLLNRYKKLDQQDIIKKDEEIQAYKQKLHEIEIELQKVKDEHQSN